MTATKRVEYYAKLSPTKHGWEARVYRKEWHSERGWHVKPVHGTRRWSFTDERLQRKVRKVIAQLRADDEQEDRGYTYYPIEGQP